jgi:micrococcal nuclease
MTPFVYRAQCIGVVDGDTADLVVDLGFHLHKRERFRLLRVDTPELNSKDPTERGQALAARQYLAEKLSPGPFDAKRWPLIIATEKSDSFGRWLCEVFVDGFNVNDELLASGLAREYRRG